MNHNNLSTSNFEWRDARRIIFRILLLGIPFLLAASFIAVIDPFNYLGISKLIPDEAKKDIANQFNPCFWKMNQFDKKPIENVLLGDSKMAPFSVEEIKKVSGEDYANLGYGGGSLKEIGDSFWHISKRIKLKKVYLSVSLDKYNDYEITDRLKFYTANAENPALYFLNQSVWESAYYNVKVNLMNEKFTVGVPFMAKEDFWDEEIAIQKKYYNKYSAPDNYRKELKKIAEYCDQNNIKLTFIIFPTHINAQQAIIDTNMLPFKESMVKDLKALADLYDYNWENELTSNKDNFGDLVHINEESRAIVIKEIWGKSPKFGKFYPKGS